MSSTILLTGANGDIGRQVVDQALGRGQSVIAAVRDRRHIPSFATNENLKFVIMHTDNQESVKNGFSEISTLLSNKAPKTIIHCAAIEIPSTIEYLKPEQLTNIIQVNTAGSLYVLQEAMACLRGTGGSLILASSLWGRVSAPLVGPYAASKWALEAIADAARRETRGMGFNIILANIGAVKSRMVESHIGDIKQKLAESQPQERQLYSALYQHHSELIKKASKTAITADKVAEKLLAIADTQKPRARYRIGADAKLLCLLSWLLPSSFMDKIIGGPLRVESASNH